EHTFQLQWALVDSKVLARLPSRPCSNDNAGPPDRAAPCRIESGPHQARHAGLAYGSTVLVAVHRLGAQAPARFRSRMAVVLALCSVRGVWDSLKHAGL